MLRQDLSRELGPSGIYCLLREERDSGAEVRKFAGSRRKSERALRNSARSAPTSICGRNDGQPARRFPRIFPGIFPPLSHPGIQLRSPYSLRAFARHVQVTGEAHERYRETRDIVVAGKYRILIGACHRDIPPDVSHARRGAIRGRRDITWDARG